MSNSPLVVHTNISPNKTSPRNHAIDTITIHCVVGQVTAENLGLVFKPTSRAASSNYGVDKDGRVGMYVEEKDRSWCSGGKDKNGNAIRVNGISGADNDHRAVTIEVASDAKHPYAVTAKALAALINLCVDICKRNGIKKLLWEGNKALVGNVAKQNMTVHRWFAAKSCPGDYLYERQGYIADEVNKRLGTTATPTTPSEPSAPSTAATEYKVDDIVQFTSGGVYGSANASVPTHSRGKSRCKVTKVSNGKHPYHLISEDGQGVYGWVDSADIEPTANASGQIVAGSRVKIKPGAKYYTGAAIPSWVLQDIWLVNSVKGDRVVLGKNVSGKNNILSAVNKSNLTLA